MRQTAGVMVTARRHLPKKLDMAAVLARVFRADFISTSLPSSQAGVLDEMIHRHQDVQYPPDDWHPGRARVR
jgi:hypothetical protein